MTDGELLHRLFTRCRDSCCQLEPHRDIHHCLSGPLASWPIRLLSTTADTSSRLNPLPVAPIQARRTGRNLSQFGPPLTSSTIIQLQLPRSKRPFTASESTINLLCDRSSHHSSIVWEHKVLSLPSSSFLKTDLLSCRSCWTGECEILPKATSMLCLDIKVSACPLTFLYSLNVLRQGDNDTYNLFCATVKETSTKLKINSSRTASCSKLARPPYIPFHGSSFPNHQQI